MSAVKTEMTDNCNLHGLCSLKRADKNSLRWRQSRVALSFRKSLPICYIFRHCGGGGGGEGGGLVLTIAALKRETLGVTEYRITAQKFGKYRNTAIL